MMRKGVWKKKHVNAIFYMHYELDLEKTKINRNNSNPINWNKIHWIFYRNFLISFPFVAQPFIIRTDSSIFSYIKLKFDWFDLKQKKKITKQIEIKQTKTQNMN